MKKYGIIGIAVIVLGIFVSLMVFSNQDELTEEFGLNTEDISELIVQLENENFGDQLSASITSEAVIVNTENKTYNFSIVEEDFHYISFAPYISLTHDCYNHSLTGCLGELTNKTINIDIYYLDGTYIESKTLSTGEDGFIGLFLDKNIDYRIVVTYQNMTSTFETNTQQTCYTGVKLV